MRISLILVSFLLIMVVEVKAQDDKFRVYIGTYTGEGSQGIYSCELSLDDGGLTQPILAAETSSPSFLAIDPTESYLYAVNEDRALVSAFSIEKGTGVLTFLNSQSSHGDAPCHLTIDAKGKNVLVANYSGGNCICLPIESDGRLGAATSVQQHVGPRTHAHSIHLDRANRFALCCDLGLDKVLIYGFDSLRGVLEPHSEFVTPQGSGPRHFAWHPSGEMAFINGELNMTLIACAYDNEKGELIEKQVLSTLPTNVQLTGGSTAETVVHPNGKFVYVSNRDPYNSIAIFSLDADSKKLGLIGYQSDGIKTPRNFAIEPTGQWMLVANQSGGDVIVFRINQDTGELIPTDVKIKVDRPVCVRFAQLVVDH